MSLMVCCCLLTTQVLKTFWNCSCLVIRYFPTHFFIKCFSLVPDARRRRLNGGIGVDLQAFSIEKENFALVTKPALYSLQGSPILMESPTPWGGPFWWQDLLGSQCTGQWRRQEGQEPGHSQDADCLVSDGVWGQWVSALHLPLDSGDYLLKVGISVEYEMYWKPKSLRKCQKMLKISPLFKIG